MVEISLQHKLHQNVAQLNWVTHLVQVVDGAKIGFMLSSFARINTLLMM